MRGNDVCHQSVEQVDDSTTFDKLFSRVGAAHIASGEKYTTKVAQPGSGDSRNWRVPEVNPDALAAATIKASGPLVVFTLEPGEGANGQPANQNNDKLVKSMVSRRLLQGDDKQELKVGLEEKVDVVFGLLIVINGAVIGLECDYAPRDVFSLPWYVVEVFFCIAFIIEMVLRMHLLGICGYFLDHWNKFDFFLVMTSVLDTCILTWLPKTDGQGAVRVMAVLRIFRLFRLCRILRLLRAFKELWLLVKGLMEAMKTLVWTALLLFIILYMASIFIVQMVGENAEDWGEDRAQIEEWFGGMPESMFTLFQVMTMEGWGTIARLVMKVQPYMVVFFIIYLMVTSFAIMNLIIAVICESTFASASETEADISSLEENEKLLMLQALPKLFEESDLDMDGFISLSELRNAMTSRPDIFSVLVGDDGSSLLHDAEAIYGMLDMDGSGGVDLGELLAGFLRMKGFHDQEMEGLNLLVSLRNMKAELSSSSSASTISSSTGRSSITSGPRRAPPPATRGRPSPARPRRSRSSRAPSSGCPGAGPGTCPRSWAASRTPRPPTGARGPGRTAPTARLSKGNRRMKRTSGPRLGLRGSPARKAG
jgi:voltage-gated sodium channel